MAAATVIIITIIELQIPGSDAGGSGNHLIIIARWKSRKNPG
jgi:hypothetical protein